jgi:hypothetical protein
MAQVVDWNEFGEKQKAKAQNSEGRKELKFITMGKKGIGHSYKLRPVGDIVQFNEYMIQHDGRWRSAITGDPENCPIRVKHGEKPKEVYAVNVIDRSDGQVKILKGPVSVFKEFHSFWRHHGKNPGGPNGGDFDVTVTGKKGKDYYRVEYDKQTPLEQDEVDMLSGNLYNLENIYKETPSDAIEEKLYPSGEEGESEGNSGGNQSSQENSAVNANANTDSDDDSIPF